MDTKFCKVCNQDKPASEYYSGVGSRCKECHKEAVRKNRKANIEYYRAYDIHRYRRDPERRAAIFDRAKKKIAASPAMRRANVMAGNAIRDGRLIRQPCEVCGNPKSEAHHCDYLRPFDVMWLCRSHHIQWHHDNGPGLNADAPIEGMDTKAA